MSTDFPPPLGGEADPNSWCFKKTDEEGSLPNPVGHTFPLLTHDLHEQWHLLGTGFYISSDGLFVTARHVIDPVLDNKKQIAPIVILHLRSSTGLFGPSEVLYRPTVQCWLSDQADIALGVAATATNNVTREMLRHWCWPLAWNTPAIGVSVATYAFPRHHMSKEGQEFLFQPELYSGTVLGTGNYRDRVIIPFPYLELDCRVHAAASGGPISLNSGNVVGVNCTELSGNRTDHPSGPAFGTQIQCLSEAFLLASESAARRVTFRELVEAGCIRVTGYTPQDNDNSASGYLVRLDELPVTAAHPQIRFVEFA